jgi:hypothetical protein
MSEATREDPFFIGWLKMPAAYRRFLVPVVAVLLLGVAGVAFAVAFLQRDPGKGIWDTDRVQTFNGIVYSRPYAWLRVPGANPGAPPRAYLLVEEGKFGALPRVESILRGQTDGRAVRVKGTLLHRDGRSMIELTEGEEGLRPLNDDEARQLSVTAPLLPQLIAEQTTLDGQIIDPKCYLGAMKPGGGKTHKSCAMLCVSGGIPPMLVTRDSDKHETFYLLTTADGGPANELVLPFVGDAVTISGRLEKQDDLFLLRLGPGAVRRR